jgi:hypothetical protein
VAVSEPPKSFTLGPFQLDVGQRVLLRDSFWGVVAALGAGVCGGKAPPRLALKSRKRKQEGGTARVRLVSSYGARSAGISAFNFACAQDYALVAKPS